MFRSAVLLLTTLLLPVSGLARPKEVPERTHEIVLEDYFSLNAATGCVQSPSGAYVAYTEMRWDEELDRRNTDLWVVDTKTAEPRRLTFDPAGDGSPQWDPAETWIYFSSARKRGDREKAPYNGKTQVWRVRPEGGEVFAVTRLPKGIKSFRLSRDGKSLYYTTSKEQVDDDLWKDLRKKFKDVSYAHGVADYRQVWKLDLTAWRAEKLVDEDRYIVEFSVAPDESRIAMITRPDAHLISNEGWSRVDLYDAATGNVAPLEDHLWREAAPSPYGWILGLNWTSDSRTLAFRVDFDGYPGEVFFADFGGGDREPSLHQLVRPHEVTIEGGMAWVPGTHDFCFAADDFGRRRVYCVRDIHDGGQGDSYTMTPGDVSVDAFSFSEKRAPLAVLRPGLNHPSDIFLVPNPGPDARWERLTRLNPQVDTWKVPQLSIYKWTSPDGTPVEGILELPPDYTPGDGPLPLLVALHGGPTASSRLHFRFWIYGHTLWAAQGWAVLDPNYRGSTGYGDTFLTDLVGHKNDRDVADILSGVDALIADGIADENRMAVGGWSNGGYLTNCVITHDNRFKAASSGAGVFDTVMQWEIEDTPGHVINFTGGFPWSKPEAMQGASPLYNVDKVTTPTLIHVGQNDPRVPPQHSRGLFRALYRYLGVPTELIVYPDEGHGLRKMSHRRAKLNWDQRWFDHYVLGKDGPEKAPESEE